MKSYEEMLLGLLAVTQGLITAEQLQACYAEQREAAGGGHRTSLSQLTVDKGMLTAAQVHQLDAARVKLERKDPDYRLGRVIVEETLVTVDEVEQALHAQAGGAEQGVGELLVARGVLEAEELPRLVDLARNRPERPAPSQPALTPLPSSGGTAAPGGVKLPPGARIVPPSERPVSVLPPEPEPEPEPEDSGSSLPPLDNLELGEWSDSDWSSDQNDAVEEDDERKLLPEGTRFATYELIEEIASGGMGTIYRATHLNLGRTVAVKTLGQGLGDNPAVVRRFITEAKALAKLLHPNIVQVYNVGKVDETYFIEMEFVEGEDLHALIKREAPLLLEQAVTICRYVIAGLKAAWEAGIVHRDVKPENVLVSTRQEVKLTDFGIVKMFGSVASGKDSAEIVGSPYYIAPEQAKGEGDIDFRADVYSLGATFWRMLTTRPPFEGANAMEIIAKHLHRPLTAREDLGVEMDPQVYAVLEQMLAKDPADRYASWDEVDKAMEGLLLLGGCPSCGNPMEPDHIICIDCGFNRKVGMHLQTSFGRKSNLPQIKRGRRGGGGRRRTTGNRRGLSGSGRRRSSSASGDDSRRSSGEKPQERKRSDGGGPRRKRRRRRR